MNGSCYLSDLNLHDPVTWYGINYAGPQITQWDFQNKWTLTSPARLSFVLKVLLRYLRPSKVYFLPCERDRAKTSTCTTKTSWSSIRNSFFGFVTFIITSRISTGLSGRFPANWFSASKIDWYLKRKITKAKFRRPKSHETNWMQMRKILCSPSLAFDSTYMKYGV